MNNENVPLIDAQAKQQTTTINEVPLSDPVKKDPTHSVRISFDCDYYSLTWASLRVSAFMKNIEDIDCQKVVHHTKTLRGQSIYLLPQDYFAIYFDFIIFMLMISVTLFCVVRQVIIDDEYIEGTAFIITARIIAMFFAVKRLTPEVISGYSKYLYTLSNKKDFTYQGFAKFVAICQIFNACASLAAILFFLCAADKFSVLLTNFCGLCVLAELDDWIGNVIMNSRLSDEKNASSRELMDLEDLNSKMNVFQKMAMINVVEDLSILINSNSVDEMHWSIRYFLFINSYLDWNIILPLLTIPSSYLIPIMTNSIRTIVHSTGYKDSS